MANELDLNKVIEKYSVLGQLHQTRDRRLPLRIPDNLTAGEYYNLAEQYIQCRWVHHALESLQRAADLNPEWMSEIDHLRKTTLPRVIPEVEAVEANLLARNAFHFKSSIDYQE